MMPELFSLAPVFESVIHPGIEMSLGNADVVVYGHPDAPGKIAAAIQSGHEPVTLEIGMGATMPPAPGLLAYLEMGVQRLKPLVDFGFNNVLLRLFSTAGLRMNGEDAAQVKNIQWQQKSLFDRYLSEFYPELTGRVDTADICQPLAAPGNVNQLVELIKQNVPALVLADLAVCGFNHGGILGQANALKYAACHLLPQTFGHSPDKGCRVAIGCQGEHVFNMVRHLMPEPKGADPSVSLVIKNILSKTAPYLYRDGAIGKLARSRNGYSGPITFTEMAEIVRYANSDSWRWQPSLMGKIKSHFRSHDRWDKIPQILELKYMETVMLRHDNNLERFSNFCKQEGGKQ